MTSRKFLLTRTAGVCFFLLIVSLLICGCLQVEPEELPPPTAMLSPTIPVRTTERPGDALKATVIIIPTGTGIFTGPDFSGY